MEIALTTGNVVFALGILGTIFTVYNYFKNPQIRSEQIDALLQQRIQWQTESNEKRFTELQNNIKDAFLLAQNHTHTVGTQVENLTTIITNMGNQIVRLQTLVDERLPRK